METGRLLWLIALFFSLVLLLQYIQLPYSYVLSSWLSFGKSQVASPGSFPSGNVVNPTIVKNRTDNDKPSTDPFHTRGSSNSTVGLDNELNYTDVKNRNRINKHDLELETDKPSTDPSGSFLSLGSSNNTLDADSKFSRTDVKNQTNVHDLEPEKGKPSSDPSRSFLSQDSFNDTVGSDNNFNPTDAKNQTDMHDFELETEKPSSNSSRSFLSRDLSNTTIDSEDQTDGHNINPVTDKSSSDSSRISRVVGPHHTQTNLATINGTALAGNKTHLSSQKSVTKRHGRTTNPNLIMNAKGEDLTGTALNISGIVTFTSSSDKRRRGKGPLSVVVPISKMSDMLRQSSVSYQPVKPEWSSPADNEIWQAKMLIENARIIKKIPRDVDANVYRNYSMFVRSYELMEKTLKIYVYPEGERPIFHQPVLDGIYASEGWFMKHLEENKHFITKNASNAHLFYFPFSSRLLQERLYVKDSHNRKNLVAYLGNYVKTINTKYSFWNRTSGADHFLVACHDWAPAETNGIMKNCIRALCNANVRGGLQFGKDVSLPEIYVRNSLNPLKDRGGKPPSQRHILAFFAGNMHGYLRPILLDYWKDKDPEMQIYGKLQPRKGQMTYAQYMKSSKYCISAKGYEPYTPRVVEAIFYECVPVIVSDNYVPPFFETLNWEAFAVFVLEKDIPNLKRILKSIPEERYRQMQERVRKVQKHFLWNKTPVKFDVFHMILHSVWYTRVFQMRP